MNSENELKNIQQMLKESFPASEYEELLKYTAELYLNLRDSIGLAKNIQELNNDLINLAMKNDKCINEVKYAFNEMSKVYEQNKVTRIEQDVKINQKVQDLYKVSTNIIEELPAKARSETARTAGRARAANDEKTKALDEIEKIALEKKEEFSRRGFQAKFIRDMLESYTLIEDEKSIEKRLKKLKNENSISKISKVT